MLFFLPATSDQCLHVIHYTLNFSEVFAFLFYYTFPLYVCLLSYVVCNIVYGCVQYYGYHGCYQKHRIFHVNGSLLLSQWFKYRPICSSYIHFGNFIMYEDISKIVAHILFSWQTMSKADGRCLAVVIEYFYQWLSFSSFFFITTEWMVSKMSYLSLPPTKQDLTQGQWPEGQF